MSPSRTSLKRSNSDDIQDWSAMCREGVTISTFTSFLLFCKHNNTWNNDCFTLSFSKSSKPGSKTIPRRLSKEHAKLRVEESQKPVFMWKSHILKEAFKKSSIFQHLIQQTPLRHLYSPRNRYIQENPKESKTDEMRAIFQKMFKELMMSDAINVESKRIANNDKLERKYGSHKVLTKPSHKREPFKKSNSTPDTNPKSSDSNVSLKIDSNEDKKDSENSKTYAKFPYIMNNPKTDLKMIVKENPDEKSKTCSPNSLYLDTLIHIKLPHLKYTCFDKQLMNYSHNNAKKAGKGSGAESGDSKDTKKAKKGSKKDKKKDGKKDAGTSGAESGDSKDTKKAKKGSKKDDKKGGKKDAVSSGAESGDSKDAKKGSKKAKKGSKKDDKKKGGKKDAESSGGESGDSKDVKKDTKKDKTGDKKDDKKKDPNKGAASTDSESEGESKKGKKEGKKKGSKKKPIKKEGESTDADSESEGDSKTGKKDLTKTKKDSKKEDKKKDEMKIAESTESEAEANIMKETKGLKKEAKKDAKKGTETTDSESEASSKAGTKELIKTKGTDTESDATSIDVKKSGFRMSTKKTTFGKKEQKPMMGRVPPSRQRPLLPPCEPYILSPKVRRVCRCNIPPTPPKPRYAPLPGVEWIHKLL